MPAHTLALAEGEELEELTGRPWLHEAKGKELSWRKRAGLVCGLPVLILGTGILLLQKQSVSPRQAVGRHFLELDGDAHCEQYFNGGQDCAVTNNLWECASNDGSWAFQCCCLQGWGDFSTTSSSTTGMINWASHPDKCLDITTPYALMGLEYTEGYAFIGNCYVGNNNKHFHLPRRGKGLIQWASHPKYCLAAQDSSMDVGTRIHLVECATLEKNMAEFEVDVKGEYQLIRWAAHRDKCLRISGEWDGHKVHAGDGAKVKVAKCQEKDELQHFGLLPLHEVPHNTDYPRLFCVSLMLPFGSEVELIKTQFEAQVGIFQCHDSAVYSNRTFHFRHGQRSLTTDIMPGSLAVQFGGQWNTALNTDIFIRFWNKIVQDPRAWRNHWTAKLDPDAVFFAWRLQEVTANLWKDGDAGEPVFLNNCHLGMHGPIEVLGRHALSVYQRRSMECVKGEPYNHKQEDVFFRKCWALLGVKQVDIYNLLFESKWACDETSSTRDGRHPCFSKQVSFHPFKTGKGYLECYNRGNSMKWSTPMVANSVVPSEMNQKHG